MSVTATVLAACIMIAARAYEVPPTVLLGILQVEGGRAGQEVGPNQNGSYDLGPMQINTIWLPELSQHWEVSEKTAYQWLRDDLCTNIKVGAWILKGRIKKTGTLRDGIAHYHSGNSRFGHPYANKVIKAMQALVKASN